MKRREFLGLTGGALVVGGGLDLEGDRNAIRRTVAARRRGADWIEDSPIVNGSDVSVLTAEYLDWLEQAGVTVWVYNGLGRADRGSQEGLLFFDRVLRFIDANAGRVSLAKSLAEIRSAQDQGRIAMVVGWQSADPFRDEPGGWARVPPRPHIRSFHELGLRMCGITYNLANLFGGGCLDPDFGLTRAGRLLVGQLHEAGIIVDVGGHTGERTSLDIVEMGAGVPVVCSHSNPAALVNNPRNISDRLIEAIASTGGVIGISAINDFNARSAEDAAVRTTPQVGLDVMLDHIEHVRRIAGVEHVALGPDFTSLRPPTSGLRPATSLSIPPEMASEQSPIIYVDGFEDIRELPNVTEGLRSRGWTDADLRALLANNWLRVYQEVWGA